MEKNKEYDSKDSAHGFFWGVWAPQIFSLIVVIVFSICAAAVDYSLENFLKLPGIKEATLFVSQLAFILFMIIYNKKMNIDFLSAVKVKKKFNIFIALACAAIGATLVLLCAPFVNLFDFLFAKMGFSKSTELPIELNSVGALIFGLFALAVVPALVEELMFRGMIANGLINSAQTRKRKIVAVVLSGLIFAAIHLSIQQSIYPFVVGCVLSLLLLFTDNLIYSIIVHFVSNTIVVVSAYINYGVVEELNYTVKEGFAAFGLFVLALLIVSGLLVLIFYLVKKDKQKESEKHTEESNQVLDEQISSDEDNSLQKNSKKKNSKKVSEQTQQTNKLVSDVKNQLMQNKLLFNILAAVSAAVLIIIDFISYIN